MMKLTLFFSIFLVHACASTKEPKNLLGFYAEENFPENEHAITKRLPVYVYPHKNALGDHVDGTWIRVEDPR